MLPDYNPSPFGLLSRANTWLVGQNFTGTGSATLADASTMPAIFTGGATPTAGNLYGIAIEKSGTEELFLGINKNSITGSVPASALYLSTYTATGQISIGRGNGAGLPNTADILLGSTGNISISGNNSFTSSNSSQSIFSIVPTIAQTSTAGYNALFISPFESTTGSGGKYLINAGTNSAANGAGTHTQLFSVTDTGTTYSSFALLTTRVISGASVVNSSGSSSVYASIGGITSSGPPGTANIGCLVLPAATYTSTAATGSATNAGINCFGIPTLTTSNAWSITNLSTVYIDGAPVAGSGVTASNFYSLFINTGLSVLGGGLTTSTGAPGQANFTANGAAGGLLSNTTTPSLLFGGATNVSVRVLANGQSSSILIANVSYTNFIVGAVPITTAASGTHAWISNTVINGLGTVTAGGAAVTNTASLYVAANTATIGTNNYGLACAASIDSVIAQTTLNGTTAGTIVWSQPFQGSSYKKFVAVAAAYENDTLGNQTITFTKPFASTPVVVGNSTGLTISVSTTTLTITAPNVVTTYSGTIIIEGV